MLRYLITFLLLVGHCSGFTVWFNNIKLADSTAVPILDNTGASIEGGSGYVAAGTFSTPPEQITNFDEFQIFGEGPSSFNGIAAGFYDLRRSAPIPQGTTSAPVGERIYVVIGDGDSLSTSTDFALFDSGLTFGTENILGLGASDITITSETLTSDSLIVGDILTDVDTGLGLTFDKAIRLTTIREPLAPILSADLKDFYPSEEGEILTVDATPEDGFPTPFTYQWYFNGDAYPASQGGREAARTLTGSAVDNGTWTIVVSNTAGSASHTFDHRVYISESSSPALEVAGFYETALAQPVNIDATPIAGYPVNFTFQWYFDGNAIDAEQGGQDRIFNLLGSANENGRWSVVVTNSSGSTEQVFEYRVFNDSDGDGLSDYREQNLLGTNFELADSDSDGLSDAEEVNGLTDPNLADTDSDGLLDGIELTITNTDPIVADSDGDGTVDGEEDNDNDGLTNAQEIGIYQTNPLLADTDSDGLSDSTEIRLNLDPKTATNMEDLANELSGLRVAYNNVVADRDSRFVDTDTDGITDVKEVELETDTAEATVFYLQDAYESAVVDSRIVGRSDVTGAPGAYDLTPTAQYNAVVVDRDSRFVDTDTDGITDVKEVELETDTAEATVFYLQDAYESAVVDSRIVGRSDVTGAPGAYDLTPTAQYNAVVVDRDSRFVDTDTDGITDVKEVELETDTAEATVFYLQDAYESAVVDSRIVGRSDVTGAPGAYDLTPTAQYNAVVVDRDSRFVDTDTDGITDVKEVELETDTAEATVFYLQDAYESAVVDSRIVGRSDVTGAPGAYDLTPTAQYNAVVVDRDSRFVDTDTDGITDVKEVELETDTAEATVFYLQDAYESAVVDSRIVGRSDVTGAPGAYDLTPTAQYNAVVVDRDSRFVDTDTDGITDVKEVELETDTAEATVFYLQDAYESAVVDSRIVGRSDVTGAPGAYDLTPTAQYNAVVVDRDSRFVDTDTDGITDVKEVELETDTAEATVFYLQDAYESAVVDSRIVGRSDVTGAPGAYDLTPTAQYNAVVVDRDSRFVDTDTDGITDVKEVELETDTAEATVFYLQDAYESAVVDSRIVGRSDVTGAPGAYDLTPTAQYNAVVVDRDSRFVDTDTDGITDVKEVELETDTAEATVFYLQDAYESAVVDSRIVGRSDVTGAPGAYDLTPTAQYNAVVVDRDSRFVDTDTDGITDVKEVELETDTAEATVFYLQDAYESAVVDSRIVGRSDVTGAPGAYDLTPTAQYNAVVVDRDSRFVDTDTDGITDVKEVELETDTAEATVFYLQDAYESAVVDSRIVGRSDVTGAPGAYDLTPTAQYNAVVVDRDSRFVDTDTDGITDVKEAELQSNVTQETTFYLQSVYNTAIADAREVGRNDVTTNPQSYELTTLAAYSMVVAERDGRFIDSDGDGLTDKKESELFSNTSEETTFYLQSSYDTAITDARESGLTEVLSNPQNYNLKTEDAYNLVVAQRDARFEDTDQDGITNVKETELETDPNDGTVFYLENTGFEDAVAAARQTGRNDVVVFPFGYGLVALEEYNKVVAERDERFSDSDGDGFTDFKEAELGTSPLLETVFYLRPAYTTAIAEARQLGRNDILGSPQNFDLTTKDAFNAVMAERDARPTAEAYAAVVIERDARYLDSDGDGLTDLKEGELESSSEAETRFFLEDDHQIALQDSREAGRNDVVSNPQNFELTTRAAFNTIVTQRDARFLDSDGDGLTDEKEGELGIDANVQTPFYLENTFETIFTDAKGAALEEVLANLQNFGLITKQAYDVVLEQRNSRFLDSDGDGLTDEKERELATNSSERTNFYLENVYDSAISESLQSGRDEVTANPQNFSLTTGTAYNTLLAQRNERFLDTDGDGLTDDKEDELETDPNVETLFSIDAALLNFNFALAQVADEGGESTSDGPEFALATTEDARFADSDLDGITDAKEEELNTNPDVQTVFYLKDAFDTAMDSSRERGRTDVTTNPQNYELTSSAAYTTVLAERNARFSDSDGDGLTDEKENELASNATEETNFYLQTAYDSALSNARQTGRTEVTANPQIYNLKTQEAYDLVIAQRDARFVDSDEDGLTDQKESELNTNLEEGTSFYLQSVFETAVATAREEGQEAVTTNPANYDLTSQTLYNAVVAQRDARPTQEAYQKIVVQRDERFIDTDADGITDVKEAELSSDSQKVTTFYLGGVYQEAVLNARITGRGDVTRNPLDYELTTIAAYNTVIDQRDARPTQVAYSSMVAQRDSRPTREQYNLVVQERDTRPTVGEVKDARLGSVVLQPDGANNSVKIRFSIEETDDFRTWIPRGEINEVTMPLEAGRKFYRFALEDE